MRRFSLMAVMLCVICATLGLLTFFASLAEATALAAARNTPMRAGDSLYIGVYTNTRLFAGAMVAINSSGYAVPASDSASLNVIGRAQSTVDNRTNAEGAGDSGELSITVRRGTFRWVNGDSFTDANIGDLAFVEDDQTVQTAASASQDIIAGVIIDVDSSGVWVDTYDIGAQGASAPSSLAVSGNATVGGTLDVTGASTLGALTTTGTTTLGGTTVAVTNNQTVGGTLGVTGAGTVGGTLGVTGESSLSGGLDTLKDGSVASSTDVTNGQAVALSGLMFGVTGVGAANGWTNTVTLSALDPTAAGGTFYLYNVTGATNLVAIAQTGTFKSPAVELAAGEGVWILAPASNALYS
ncbi:MAG: hypothetical protein HQ559_04225, partial [Lentisphaerae bacterium]|nr:hypothetical protein [Lentisphaerota bacterium]